MLNEILKWIVSVLTSATVMGAILYFTRSSLTKFIGKSIEHRFEKKLENFKAEIRENEKEIEQIRAFMSSARRERDSALQAKRFEAAEALMRMRQFLGQLNIFVEYLKMLNMEEILKKRDDPKIHQFINDLTRHADIDGKLATYAAFDKTITELYLSERVRKIFEVYQSVIMNATITMKLLSMPGLKIIPDIFKKDELKSMIIELVPSAKPGFDKFGDNHAYYWLNYFHNEISQELRSELLGISSMSKDTEAAAQLATDSRQALIKVKESLKKIGLSEEFINSDAG
ncbi:hypothetical protein AGJ44_06370 [Cronobacter dublinensis subsp. dublinensis]|nr:hypothetical protein [Cronobacter dublinensis subsp. dublinensis]EGT5700013.1 hypothetical protein [Cronobacter dublinensis subsp. dublinensis]EGT5745245.1 hypothetical protein [Cronobacter dublinensis subsp. dublinensis]EGT5768546.1 hypothetical protein [Cronobacter dublinensis subsp. dublinensis]